MTDSDEPGLLVLAATPIGDVADASPALRRALLEADVVAAEDTRRFADLCRRLDLRPSARVVSHFDANEAARVDTLLDALRAGSRVVVVTDAGMPVVSDPGYRLVSAAIAEGIRVTTVPGPSAALAALAVSGLPGDRFCFEGFLPRKAGERRRRLAALAGEERTMIFFEAPHRLADFLTDAAATLGAGRRAAACRELTKTWEEVVRGSLTELAAWAGDGVRGEVTVVVEGATAVVGDPEDALADVLSRVEGGERLSSAVADVAARTGVPRGSLYDAAVQARKER